MTRQLISRACGVVVAAAVIGLLATFAPVGAQAPGTAPAAQPAATQPAAKPAVARPASDTVKDSDPNWHMAGANLQRTSWVAEEVGPRYQPVWYRVIEPYISMNVQTVAGDGKIFVSTARGLYAFQAADGATAWVYPTEMPLGHSPTYVDGVVYVGGFDRKLHCIDAKTGKRLWTFDEARAGYRTNPLVVDGLVLLGNRDGFFYAIYANGTPQAGKLKWKYDAGAPINYSAAYKDGIVYFGSMQTKAFALKASDGTEKWKTEQLHGTGFHSWWPVVWRDQVIFVTSTNYRNGQRPGSGSCPEQGPGGSGYYHDSEYKAVFGQAEHEGQAAYIGETGTEPGDWVDGTFTVDATKAAKYFGEKPWRQMTYVLDQATGKVWGKDLDGDGKQEHAPFLWTGTKNGTPPPPMVSGFDNVLYRHNQYATYNGSRSQMSGWKFGTPFVSRITNDYGASDEPHIGSGSGKYLFWNVICDRESGWIDLSKPWTAPHDRSGREGGIFPGYRLYTVIPGYDEMWVGVGDQDNTGNRLWGYYGSNNGIYHYHTNDQPPFVAYQGHLYIHRSNALICVGREGGAKKGEKVLAQKPPADERLVTLSEQELKNLLAREIQKWLDAGHLHIGYFNGSQFGSIRTTQSLNDYFSNPAENLWALLRALPHVPQAMQGPLKEFIQKEYQAYPPTGGNIGWAGASRDYFLYPPEVEADIKAGGGRGRSDAGFEPERMGQPVVLAAPAERPERPERPARAPRQAQAQPRGGQPQNVYVMWKYAQVFGDAQSIYNSAKGRIGQPPSEETARTYPYELNAWIAGAIGYLELEKLAGQPESADVKASLAKAMELRATTFSKDTPFPFRGEYNKAKPNSHANRINLSRNFMQMTPELGQYLHDNALAKVSEAVDEYNRVGPYWFVSRYEGCLQEATIQNLLDYGSVFAAKAWILQQPRTELVKYLDVPGFARGDCFYIQNLVSAIEAK